MKQFTNPILDTQQANAALDNACAIIKQNLSIFTDKCQDHSCTNGIYKQIDNVEWTTGFWPGEIWLAWEHTNDDAFKNVALHFVDSFQERIDKKIEVDHHDMGFLYTPSCVAAYKLTGDEKAKETALKAAEHLITRFQEKGQFIQAWGAFGAKENYRFIIDCLLNLPLLYWASEMTGNPKYNNIAHRHITTCLKYSIREDGSTFHTFFMNPETGEPSHGATCQGYKDDSCWARGQAWGVYGTTIAYRYTKNPEYIEKFRTVLDYYLTRLPKDLVPYWDMIFIDGNEEPRDSSSAAIVVCGLLEMAKYVQESEAAEYRRLAAQMLKSMVDDYAVKTGPIGCGLLEHGTYAKKTPYNTCAHAGVDECVSWGDYFYMEALTRFVKDWQLYW